MTCIGSGTSGVHPAGKSQSELRSVCRFSVLRQRNVELMAPRSVDTSPADLLLRYLSAGHGPLAAGKELSAAGLGQPAVWEEVANMAVREHVAPLFFKRLKENDARDRVPADVWRRLRHAYFTSGDRNTRLYRELGTVLQRLRGSGVRVIVLKGAFLAEAVYRDVALRPMCDTDLLVPRKDLAKAESILLGMGGAHVQRSGAHGADSEPGRGMRRHARPVLIRDLAVELHWTIVSPTGPFRIDTAAMWNRALAGTTAGVEALSLCPEDLLLHLCLHFCYQDGCAELRHLCDIAESIHHFRGGLDWTLVAHSAREWDALRYVGLSLQLARDLLEAPVPKDALNRLVPGGIDARLLKKARECVLAHEKHDHWSLLPFPNRFGGRWSLARVRALSDTVFLRRDEMASRYASARDSRHLWPYYVLRSADLLRNYGRATLRQGFRMLRVRERDSTPSLAGWLKSGKL
jgi:hypothetical protein